MRGKNPSLGLLLIAVAAFCVFWTLVYSGGLPQPNDYKTNSAEQHAQQKATKASDSDDRLADYTWWLTGFTGLLAFVSSVQGWLLIRADRAATIAAKANTQTTARSMELREKQIDLAEKQFLMEGKQADLMEKRHGLQRLNFLAEHRPRIEIRSIGLDTSGQGAFVLNGGEPIKGHLVIRNVGGSDATIREADYRFLCTSDGLPMVPPLFDGKAKPLIGADLPELLAAHGSLQVPIEWAALPSQIISEIRTGGPSVLYLFGSIRYSGWDTDNDRWMGFCRKYQPGPNFNDEGSFIPVDNADYEYSD